MRVERFMIGGGFAKSRIVSVGGFLPKKVLTNKDIQSIVETTDEWITQRTGITKRHICQTNTSDMVVEAVKNCLHPLNILKAEGLFVPQSSLKKYALDDTGDYDFDNFASSGYFDKFDSKKQINNQPIPSKITNIDCMIVATTTPDLKFPSTACIAQAKLKAMGYNIGFAFDVQAVCAGFVYALCIANSFIKSGLCKNVLVVGGDMLSSILDWTDRTTCVLFGDGAGCILLEKSEDINSASNILCESLHSDGSFADILKTKHTSDGKDYISMDGKDVFKHAVSKMADCIDSIILKSGYSKDAIDFVIAHQANERILDGVAKKLEMHKTNFVKTVDVHANTSSASIPLALNHSLNNGIIKRGDKIIFEALGGGLAWGGMLCIW